MREKLDDGFDGELEPDDRLVTSSGTWRKIRFVLDVLSADYRDPGTSSAARVASSAEVALSRAALLAESEGPIAVAFPLLGAGSGGQAASLWSLGGERRERVGGDSPMRAHGTDRLPNRGRDEMGGVPLHVVVTVHGHDLHRVPGEV